MLSLTLPLRHKTGSETLGPMNAEPAQPVSADLEAPENRFTRAREARQTEIAEDYVELIADLIARHGQARTIDIARALGVTHVTVNRTIARLARDGLVNSMPYRSILLTPAGEALAQRARHRHQIVFRFLRILGISPEVALQDAEGMEHHASDETLEAFAAWTRRLEPGQD
ncbi:Transcriptional regulator mntR [Granulibacter bethesdensis]|nr:Transcriptional regulator mntR [Granulibacter bethesdensis]